MQEKKIRTRFAPSPAGFMHVGNLRTALYEYLIAKNQGGDLVLRIEDTDQECQVEDAVEVIYDTLKMIGLQHDGGLDIGGPYGPYVQSEHMDTYKKYAEQLIREGKTYCCFCTKEHLASLHEENTFGGYDRHCRYLPQEETDRLLAASTPYVIRQKMPAEGSTTFHDAVYSDISVENKELGGWALLKSDGFPTYNFANMVDDHLMEITHVVRGSEYLSPTPKYNLLCEAYGWQIPTYVHLPFIKDRNADGTASKLSKRHGSTGLADLVKEGYLPEAIISYITLLGWCPKDNEEGMDMQGPIKRFSIEGISKSPAIFDYDKLTWLSGEYLRAMTPEQFTEYAMPYYRQIFGDTEANWSVLTLILQPRVTKLNEIPEMVGFLKDLSDYPANFFVNKKSRTTLENSAPLLRESISVLRELPDWMVPSLHEALLALAQRLEVKNGTFLWSARIAAAGQTVTPGGVMGILAILGQEEPLRRLEPGLKEYGGQRGEYDERRKKRTVESGVYRQFYS